jgi:hypothetical protein
LVIRLLILGISSVDGGLLRVRVHRGCGDVVLPVLGTVVSVGMRAVRGELSTQRGSYPREMGTYPQEVDAAIG